MNAIVAMARDVVAAWSDDKAPRLGAALAYYSVFSMAPLVIICVGVAGLVFEKKEAATAIIREIEQTAGEPTAQAVSAIVTQASVGETGWIATIVGLAVLLFGASAVVLELQDALNTIWRVAPRPGKPILTIVRERFLSFAVVLGGGFLLLVSLVVNAALSALGEMLASQSGLDEIAYWHMVNNVFSFAFVTLLFALIYKVLPDIEIKWRDVWIGAVLTAFLFTLGKYLIGLYLGKSGTATAFGAAASVVIVLVWVYYSAQILLLGAEFTRIYTERYGSRMTPSANAMAIDDCDDPNFRGVRSSSPSHDRVGAEAVPGMGRGGAAGNV